MKERMVIKDYTKPNYVIMRETPNGPVIISGTFTIKENAIKEVKERIKNYNNMMATGKDMYGHKVNLKLEEGWSKPYLVELKLDMIKVEVE